jgi:hypothetical protein
MEKVNKLRTSLGGYSSKNDRAALPRANHPVPTPKPPMSRKETDPILDRAPLGPYFLANTLTASVTLILRPASFIAHQSG